MQIINISLTAKQFEQLYALVVVVAAKHLRKTTCAKQQSELIFNQAMLSRYKKLILHLDKQKAKCVATELTELPTRPSGAG